MFKFCREIHQTEHGVVHFQGKTTSMWCSQSHNDVRPKSAEHIGGHGLYSESSAGAVSVYL